MFVDFVGVERRNRIYESTIREKLTSDGMTGAKQIQFIHNVCEAGATLMSWHPTSLIQETLTQHGSTPDDSTSLHPLQTLTSSIRQFHDCGEHEMAH